MTPLSVIGWPTPGVDQQLSHTIRAEPRVSVSSRFFLSKPFLTPSVLFFGFFYLTHIAIALRFWRVALYITLCEDYYYHLIQGGYVFNGSNWRTKKLWMNSDQVFIKGQK